MIQGSNMTRGHKGMRKGISLVEMLMAIVLLGLLGTISYNYYKVYYDVAFAAKQARIYVILDQAQQLSNAHDLYEVKNGAEPATVAIMVTDKQLIKAPDPIPEVTAGVWVLKTPITGNAGTIDLDGGTTADNDVAFTLLVNGTGIADKDLLSYCNIVNNIGQGGSLSETDANIKTPNAAAGYTANDTMFCYNTQAAATTPAIYELVFVKRVDPL